MRIDRSVWFPVFAILIVATNASIARAQETGRIIGTVTDADTNVGIANVQVSVEGTGLGAISGQRGTFSIPNVPAGSHTLLFNILGYDSRRESATVTAGRTTAADVALVEGFIEMGAITVIGASRTPERIVEAPAAVSVVSGAELEREAAHGQLPKLFADKPGVDVVQSGVQDFNINTRGYNSSLNRRVLVLQDGVDRSLGFLQSQEWTALSMPLEDLGRLDFVRGPGSALYGANAFSGVINITTPSPADIVGTKVGLSGGQRESGRFDVRHAGQTEDGTWGYRGNVGYTAVGNSFSESRTQADATDECLATERSCQFEYGPLPVEQAPVNDDPVSSLYGSGRVDHNFDNGSVWTGEGGTTHTENEIFVTGIGRVQVNGANRPWARTQYASDRWVALGWYSGRRSDGTGEDENNQTSLQSGLELRESSDIFHVEAQGNWGAFDDRFQLVAGASGRWLSIDTDGTLMADKQDDTIGSVFGQADIQLHPMVSALFAGRFDHFSVIDESEFAPKAALVFSPTDDHSVRFTFNRAFQVPNYSELFLRVPVATVPLNLIEQGIEAAIAAQTGMPIDLPLNFQPTPFFARGNENLTEEQLTGYELGWKGALVDGRVFATADLYYNEIDDFVTDLLPAVNPEFQTRAIETLIPAAFDAAPLNRFKPVIVATLINQLGANLSAFTQLEDGSNAFVISYANAGEVTEQGVEVGATFIPGPNWEVSANYTYFDFDIKDRTTPEGVTVPETELRPNTPQHKGNVGLVYSDPARFDAGLKVHLQEAMDWAAGVFAGPVPGYVTADLSGGWQVNELARVHLVWTNVLDKEHYQLFGGSVLGSRAIGGVTLTF